MEGGEVEEQHDVSEEVDSALRKGPESKMLGTDSRKLLLLWLRISRATQFSTHVLIQVIFLRHGEEGGEGGEVEEQHILFGGVHSTLRNGP